jgi:cytochrome c556
MMLTRTLVIAVAWTAFAAQALPQEAPSSVTGTDAIAARQASMDMSSVVLRSMAAAIKTGGEAKAEAYPAAALAKWAKIAPRLFPLGTGKGETAADTQAKPAIWQDRAGFGRVAANYAAAAAELAVRAKANDRTAFTRQLVVVDQACHACHEHYKEGMQSPPLDVTSR